MEKKKSYPTIPRVATGFERLDEMLQGGLPQNTVTLLSGACGTGKSTLAMQFLYYGAAEMDEPGVYVTLEENPESLIRNMSIYGWDIEGLIKSKKLIVVKPEMYKFDSLKQIIEDAIDRIGAKRLVVDSYSVLLTYFSDPNQIRNGLVQLDREIKKMGCTALVISDIRDNAEIFSTTGVEEFIVDGVIVLLLVKDIKNPYVSHRAIAVRKMRATKHPLQFFSFDIDEDGVVIGNCIGCSEDEGKPTKAAAKGHHASAPHKAGKPTKNDARPASKIDINSLRRKGHSWKWKYL